MRVTSLKAVRLIGLALLVLAATAIPASAASSEFVVTRTLSQGYDLGACPCNAGLPVASVVTPSASVQTHLAPPAADAIAQHARRLARTSQSEGFDYADAALGAGITAGVGVLVIGLAVATRRRRGLVSPVR